MGESWQHGKNLFLLLLLSVLRTTVPAPVPKLQYVVLVPSTIHMETSENFCIQMNHLEETLTLTIFLESGSQNLILNQVTIKEKDGFQCVPFQIPRWSNISPPSEAVLVMRANGLTQNFWSRKKVLIEKPKNLLFIQTDKPIYRAGQQVQFRIVSMDKDFHPTKKKFPFVYIQDPQKNRVFQWRDVEVPLGIIQLSYSLSSDPLLGTYKVVIEKDSTKVAEDSFDVEEYVLPKFEVLVKAPKLIQVVTKEIEVSVCGRYTYGKPVPGLVKLSFCRHPERLPFQCNSGKSMCKEFEGKTDELGADNDLVGGEPKTSWEAGHHNTGGMQALQADGDGCFSKVVNTEELNLMWLGFSMAIAVEGKITEEGTGVEMNGTESIEITSTLSKITFENPDRYYKPGIPYVVKVKLVDSNEVPIHNETVRVLITSRQQELNQVTDAEGRAQFSIETTDSTHGILPLMATYQVLSWCGSIHWVTPRHIDAFHTAHVLYSPSRSYLHIEPVSETLSCGHRELVRVRYILNRGDENEDEIVFYYMIKAKGDIIQTGTHWQPVDQGKANGDFLLNLLVDVDTAPKTRLLLYTILPSGELVADSRDFTVEKCFSNKAKLWFSDQEGLPGQKAQLHLSASPGSLCAIHAVDQSVFLLKPEAELSPEKVYNFLPKKNYIFSDDLFLDETNLHPCPAEQPFRAENIGVVPPNFFPGDGDSYNIFRDFGLSIFTNTKLRNPRFCSGGFIPVMEFRPGGALMPGGPPGIGAQGFAPPPGVGGMAAPGVAFGVGSALPRLPTPLVEAAPKRTPRRFFPETWIWDLVILNGSQGNSHSQVHQSNRKRDVSEEPKEIALPVTIPDTITEWKAGAFCLSADTGFGLAQPAFLKAFQPFFIELTLPYSVVRGEAFPLKATVFSYLTYCIRVRISLTPSADFEASPMEKEEGDSYCICANGRKTVSWMMTPKILGEINLTASAEAVTSNQLCGNEVVEVPTIGNKDVVIKSLLVEPEGIEKEVVFNSLLCAPGKPESKSFPLMLPENVVEGSARASFCVLGDILGGAIKNLHQLLKMPYGCGEQNMALFAPNIYILNYLKKTGQLTEEIKSKAVGYLEAGYQRQLNYKHPDGSYSAFGKGSEEGNTWLTAFVLKSFARARSIIFVEDKHINDAQNSLTLRQENTGCFRSTGSLFNNALKGGVDDQTTLSTYITIALLEVPLPPTHSVVQNALLCLEKATEAKEIHIYLRALLAYTFALAGKEEKRQEMLDSLLKVAVKDEDGSIHWERPGKPKQRSDFPLYLRAPSAEVEMTSYGLLAFLTNKLPPSQEELTIATAIVKWLLKQQNSNGGYSSTQDTVVALQALSQYRTVTYSKDGIDARATLSSGDAVLAEFHVDSNNSLLLQCQDLPQVPGNYKAEVTGCIFMQTALKYNVPLRQEDAPFRLDVQTVPETCTGIKAHITFDIAMNVSYTGQRLVSNMAIVQIKMLSGYIPVKSSVKKLEKQGQIKRSEVNINHVLLYLDEVRNTIQTFSFTVEQETPVRGLKPALVKVYDYYETDEFATAEYTAPCSSDDIKEVYNA
ncbi:alpha-2-macroglobulin-like isoform X2 [Pituophis catenifer annectens]|uniref:alpha-2-macroglobulin-like isoform X2 n=1 Tax=Pituophis catenifer annectens TaxID=94852 RepID=UPI003995C5A4